VNTQAVPEKTAAQIALDAARRRRSTRWMLTVGAAAMLAIASVLMFLLTLATNNQTRFERYYEPLLLVNLVVAALFFLVLLWAGWRLISRVRRQRFGSRLLLKLAAVFALVGFLPGLLIYVVSYQFVSRSIESWFNVKVEGALDAGINLGRSTIDSLSADLAAKSRAAATQLADMTYVGPLALERLREQIGATDVMLWSGSGQLLGSAGQSRFVLAPERPSSTQMRSARQARAVTQVEGLEEAAIAAGARGPSASPSPPAATSAPAPAPAPASGAGPRIRVLAFVGAPGSVLSGLGVADARYLQVTQAIAPALVSNALAVQDAYKEYQERALARDGLRNMYLSTLTLSLFLAMFGAILLAVLLGNQLVRPLLVLADGVAQVAAGDLTPKAALQTKDELGGLTRSFAQMTQQLSDARSQLQSSLHELDASRTHLQTILDNLTAGVMVLDTAGQVVQANPGATRVLRAPIAAFIGQPLAQVPGLQDFARDVAEQFRVFFGEQLTHDVGHWQHSFDLASGSLQATDTMSAKLPGAESTTSIIARGAALPGGLRLLVFDDITEIVSAQRSRAWGEVARRLAHEIKNPLTPIQLSAERLELKLQGKLPQPDEALLVKSVKTIVDQVDAMKRLVNEFRDYARLPSAELKALQLNDLVTEVLALYAPDHSVVPVVSQLDPACPPIMGDAQQLRQVIHNLLQNAQDATLSAVSNTQNLLEEKSQPIQPAPKVEIITRYSSASSRVRLIVRDCGTGFAPHILQRAFEPYVTTKARGTGLGLAVVKKIADEHGARIELSNRSPDTVKNTTFDSQFVTENEPAGTHSPSGAQVSLSFPVM
jgi:nitrogen fixation/metabolism regulation signal transduction histidine kinase